MGKEGTREPNQKQTVGGYIHILEVCRDLSVKESVCTCVLSCALLPSLLLQLLTSNPFSAGDSESWEAEKQQLYGHVQVLQKQLWEETSARIEAQVG